MRRIFSSCSGNPPVQANEQPEGARLNAAGMVQPSESLTARLNAGMRSSMNATLDVLTANRRDARSAARQEALSNVSTFYRMRTDPEPNGAYLEESEFGRTSQRDQVALRRQNSFLSVVRQLDDVQALAFTPGGELMPRLDPDCSKVLNETLKTIQLLPIALQEAALARARAGQRSLPLTLDASRMKTFLADNEVALSQVVQACAGGRGNAQRLAGPVQALATDYLRRNGQLPSGLPPNLHVDYRGVAISNDPVSVFIDRFPDNHMEILTDNNTSRDKVVLSLGSQSVSEPLRQGVDSIATGFQSRSSAEKRAATVLQSLFQLLTAVEEAAHASGLHARTEADRRKGLGTKAEFEYLGSPRIGDATDPQDGGASQRLQKLVPLLILAQVEGRQRAAGRAPLVADRVLAKWLDSARFKADINEIAVTNTRLANAQTPLTAAALLQSRAFGGRGLR